MMKILFERIVLIAVWLILGAFNFYNVPFCSQWQLTALGFVTALFCFFMAWLNYRRARKIAEAIDTPKTLTLTIIHHGEESESKGQEQAEKSVETEIDRQDESEDYCAHPI